MITKYSKTYDWVFISLSVFITVMWLEFCALFVVVAVLLQLLVVVGAEISPAVDVDASIVVLPLLLLLFAPLTLWYDLVDCMTEVWFGAEVCVVIEWVVLLLVVVVEEEGQYYC